MRTRYCQKAEQTQLWWYNSTGHVSRTRGTTLHEIRHRDLSETSSRSAELPTLQTLIRCHCSFYLSFYYNKASVGKASPSIIVLLCCHAATPQEPAYFGGVLWGTTIFWHRGHSLGQACQGEGGATTACSSLTLFAG